jgi:hypothetical protein
MKGAALDLACWISDYAACLASHGYTTHAIDMRGKHLDYLNRFIEARGLQTLEHFPPEWASDFIDYWMHHHPAANKNVAGFQHKSRFEPHHHRDVQFSLRCFIRWAHAAGRLQQNPFPLRPLVTGHYVFPEMMDYQDFCQEHKGLARNSCSQIETLVRRFDRLDWMPHDPELR